MTNETETIVPPVDGASIVPPTPATETATPTVESLLAELEASKSDWLLEQLMVLKKKADKQAEKDSELAQEKALAANAVAFSLAILGTAKDAIPQLGIVIPEKGLKFLLTITRAADGSPLGTLENANKKATTRATGGTRAASGTGSGRDSVMQITDAAGNKPTGFIVGSAEVKSAADVAKALDIFKYGENQGRIVAAFAKNDKVKANEISIVIGGKPEPLGDAVARMFPPKVAGPATA